MGKTGCDRTSATADATSPAVISNKIRRVIDETTVSEIVPGGHLTSLALLKLPRPLAITSLYIR